MSDPALKEELERTADQLVQMEQQAKMGGPSVGVRVKDVSYLVDLLRRAAVQA